VNNREKAVQAQAILNNEVFREVLSRIESDLIIQWKSSDSFDQREFCWCKINALRSITEDLEALVATDKIENHKR